MFDAADFALFGAAPPPISREFALGPVQAGFLATIGFVGALFWGTLSDYIGHQRRRVGGSGKIRLSDGWPRAAGRVFNKRRTACVIRAGRNLGLSRISGDRQCRDSNQTFRSYAKAVVNH